ncbi:GntR family transcriptional regulator [Catenuloplanes indicus]|uniref:DNA-binding GntR family transcriptional regulator n=1 Tax=Catenuloplanes indicus TaxID=137267 RepID=A0AAE3VZI9_9ACTN|nr:GntR family transcriptional regulator [Catenuloplanes indicus]MDQ0366492.1 DNA-binding GntR family transcriptional regulator [Catenuloplanes indicus]
MRPVRRLTLTDDVYTSVQTLIMDHAVAPGEKINIDALARRLQVSPTPVREALARLESDGLVRKRALVGYTASPLLSRAEFEDLIEMRLLLEPAAAAKAVHAEDLRAEADLPVQPDAPGFQGIAGFTAQDARFHHRVAELSGNGMLHDAIVRLRSHLHLFRLNFPQSHYGTSAAEHHRIVDAIAAGDGAAAGAAMHDHITAARERHLSYFGS